MSVLALDVGTTGRHRAGRRPRTASVLRRGYQEFPQHFPRPGWVEHEPEEIWQAVLAPRPARRWPARRAHGITCVGITDQRETAVLWDRRRWPLRAGRSSGRTAAPQRSARRARTPARRPRVAELTGLRLDPYFTATKLDVAGRRTTPPPGRGSRPAGPPSGPSTRTSSPGSPAATRFVTDASNASRTLLFDLRAGAVERGALRAVRRADERAARGRPVVRRGRPHRPRAPSSASTSPSRASPATSRRRCSARAATTPAAASAPTARAPSCW